MTASPKLQRLMLIALGAALLFVALLGVFVMMLALLLTGCATNGVKADSFPAGVPCVQARADAVQWYRDTRHQEPRFFGGAA